MLLRQIGRVCPRHRPKPFRTGLEVFNVGRVAGTRRHSEIRMHLIDFRRRISARISQYGLEEKLLPRVRGRAARLDGRIYSSPAIGAAATVCVRVVGRVFAETIWTVLDTIRVDDDLHRVLRGADSHLTTDGAPAKAQG